MKRFKWISSLVVLFSSLNSAAQVTTNQLQKGDILFIGTSGKLSKAIDKVTQTNQSTNFTHMGIVVSTELGIWVLHADPKLGVVKEDLTEFANNNKVAVYRLKENKQNVIENALNDFSKYLGHPYNSTYIIEDKGYYCSELIYELFATDSIFQLQPMTFKNPQTGKFNKTWIKHYQKLGIEIPEGKPGCNPNEMATNTSLMYMGNLRQK
ncbi:hypothetical protein EMN47_03640 [Prolixibacteraceae bacterium JC049]|nr:hypothetical protein [Prolixibacteraceae bacterium JC049]